MRPDGLLELFLCHSWALLDNSASTSRSPERRRRGRIPALGLLCVIPSVAEGPRFLPCRVSVTPLLTGRCHRHTADARPCAAG